MNAYIEITRPGNAVMAAIAVLLMAIINFNYSIPIILCFFVVLFATSGGNVINDFFDYKIDKINKPNRPIPSGRISLNAAKWYSYSLFLIAILFSFIISFILGNYVPVVFVSLCCVLMYYYAKYFKAMPLVGNISVSLLTALCFVLGGLVLSLETNNNAILLTGIIIGFFAFFMTLAREITKDMEDIEGDRLENAKTLPIVKGNKFSSILTSILIILTALISPVLYFLNIFSIYYLIGMIIPILIFIYCAYLILKSQDPEICNKVSKLLKFGMLISFLCFILGVIPL